VLSDDRTIKGEANMLKHYIRTKSFLSDEKGQTAVEYCVMIGLVALALIAASPSLTGAITAFFGRVTSALGTVGS
jgi:pilus assembly protein Flp/PilA